MSRSSGWGAILTRVGTIAVLLALGAWALVVVTSGGAWDDLAPKVLAGLALIFGLFGIANPEVEQSRAAAVIGITAAVVWWVIFFVREVG